MTPHLLPEKKGPDLGAFEVRLERQRFRPMREYVMALEARIMELEASCR